MIVFYSVSITITFLERWYTNVKILHPKSGDKINMQLNLCQPVPVEDAVLINKVFSIQAFWKSIPEIATPFYVPIFAYIIA